MIKDICNMGAASSSFPYALDEQVHSPLGESSIWEICKGHRKTDNHPVTILKLDKTKSIPSSLVLAENMQKRLSLVKHPNVLSFIDSVDLPEAFFVVTESAVPLSVQTPSLEEITLGLFQIIQALSFLSNNCKLVHGNISRHAIFVTDTSDWKLSGFEYTFPLQDFGSPGVPSHWLPPEGGRPSNVWALDSWSLACLIQELFNGPFSRPQDLKRIGKIPETLVKEYKQLLSTNPRNRVNPQEVLQSEFFNTPIVQIVSFLDHFSVKSTSERDLFFKTHSKQFQTLPTVLKQKKLLPLLSNALKFASGDARVLSALLQTSQDISEHEFRALVLPVLLDLFASNERSMRVALLKNMERFAHFLSQSDMESILPHLKTGFSDQISILREWTVKSLIFVVPKLKERSLQVSVFPFLAKLQKDPEAAIRTNTVVVVGKLGKHLSSGARKKVLLPTFARALRDPFVPARKSAIAALRATMELYDPEEIAGRVLPVLAVHSIDPSKNVRDLAFSTIETCLTVLKEHSNAMPDILTQEKEETGITAAVGVIGQMSSWASSITSSTVPPQSDISSPSPDRTKGMGMTQSSPESPSKDTWDVFNDFADASAASDLLDWRLMDSMEQRQPDLSTAAAEIKPKSTRRPVRQRPVSKTTVKSPIVKPQKSKTHVDTSKDGWEDFLNDL